MPKTSPKRKARAIVRRKPESRAIVKPEPPTVAEAIEKVLIAGDLTPLTPEQRVQYYNAVCKSLGLNPLTSPFTYILFREADGSPAKLQLYANKDCAAQLRKIHGVSVLSLKRSIEEDMSLAEVQVRDRWGKVDCATGVVPLWKYKDSKIVKLTGREYANAIMKTETKAKRRATLSICGLAFLDESELDTMQVVGGVTPDGRIYQYAEETGSREAQEAVAARKIEEFKAKAQPTLPEAGPASESGTAPMGDSQAPSPASAPKRIVFVKTMPDHDIAVSGYLVDEEMQKFLADVSAAQFKSQREPGRTYWRFKPEYLEDFKKLCGKLGIEVQ